MIRIPRIKLQWATSRTTPSTSADPMNRSYPGEAPIEYQITPIGEKLPYGSSSRLRKTVGI